MYLEPNEEKQDSSVLSCAKCGKEILDKESSFCAYCGVRFDSESQSSDLTTASGILAIIAATFSIGAGVLGIVNYQSYVAYFSYYGGTSDSIGFLAFLSFAFVSSGFGFAGGMFALTKKRFKFSVLGLFLMLASALFTFIALWQYQYGYIESIVLSEIATGAFSLIGALLVVKSKSEFI